MRKYYFYELSIYEYGCIILPKLFHRIDMCFVNDLALVGDKWELIFRRSPDAVLNIGLAFVWWIRDRSGSTLEICLHYLGSVFMVEMVTHQKTCSFNCLHWLPGLNAIGMGWAWLGPILEWLWCAA